MKLRELLIERIEISWVRPWVERVVQSIGPYNDDIEWYAKLFKILNSSKELKNWRRDALDAPITINPKLVHNEIKKRTIIDADHLIQRTPLKHIITVQVNVNYPPVDQKSTKNLIDNLSSYLVHEFEHASQHAGQEYKSIDTEVWKINPPDPKNDVERYFIYILNHMEKDAWVAQISNDIHNSLGASSLKYLNDILKQARKDDYAIVNNKIIPVEILNILYRALNQYSKYLKKNPEQYWDKIKKELYGYLSRYDRTK